MLYEHGSGNALFPCQNPFSLTLVVSTWGNCTLGYVWLTYKIIVGSPPVFCCTFVYLTPIQDVQSLRALIMAGCETIRNTPGIFQRIRDSIRRGLMHVLMLMEGILSISCEKEFYVVCWYVLVFLYFPSINVL